MEDQENKYLAELKKQEWHTQSIRMRMDLFGAIQSSAKMQHRDITSEINFRLEQSFKRGTIDQVLDILQRIEKRLLRGGAS